MRVIYYTKSHKNESPRFPNSIHIYDEDNDSTLCNKNKISEGWFITDTLVHEPTCKDCLKRYGEYKKSIEPKDYIIGNGVEFLKCSIDNLDKLIYKEMSHNEFTTFTLDNAKKLIKLNKNIDNLSIYKISFNKVE